MSVLKRGKVYYLRFRPFGAQINVRTLAGTKNEARRVEMSILVACRSGDFRVLDPVSRETCIRLFKNQGWELPSDLADEEPVREELILWRAAEIFLNYPSIINCKAKDRYIYCLTNLVEHFGKDKPIRSIWVPDIRQFQADRLAQGARPATINWETSTLSKLFGVLQELQRIEVNPARMIRRLSTKDGERQVYIAFRDVLRIAETPPAWFRTLVLVMFYTGMRRGEIFGLTRKQVNLSRRMIYLGPEDTKEQHWKRIPVQRDLVPVLEDALKVTSLETDRVLLARDKNCVRPPSVGSVKTPWGKAVKKMGLDPKPRPHDLRHTWRANARRSGMDPTIAESIMGHWFKGKSVNNRYGKISDTELLNAVDRMTFDHGETEVWVAGR